MPGVNQTYLPFLKPYKEMHAPCPTARAGITFLYTYSCMCLHWLSCARAALHT